MGSERATQDAWHTRPMPEAREALEIDATVEKEAYELIRRGFIPRGPEDKWFLYVEDDCLYCHRSATGTCVFTAQFEEAEDGYTLTEAWVNRDTAQYRNTDPVYDARLLVYLIRKLLLDHDVPFPMPRGMRHESKTIHEKHVMGNDKGGASFIPLDLLNGDS